MIYIYLSGFVISFISYIIAHRLRKLPAFPDKLADLLTLLFCCLFSWLLTIIYIVLFTIDWLINLDIFSKINDWTSCKGENSKHT